jgi:heterodisulfide reductase subunit B
VKTFAYYPGCSLETMAASYHVSAVEVAENLGISLVEIEDWNCCGATAYSHVDELLAQVLGARNLALAEKEERFDLVAPCSGCFKNLYFTNDHMLEDADLMEHMNFALEADDLSYSGNVRVHHLMDMFVSEVGLEVIREKVVDPLENLQVAPYYGCQMTRPRKPGESLAEVEGPMFFEDLMEALGATAVEYPYRMRCCGASLIATSRRTALSMLRDLLQNAVDAGADVITTSCPLCQINLEVYQSEVNRELDMDFSMPIMYFTQLMGLAMGIKPKDLGIGAEVVPVTPVLACRQSQRALSSAQ